PATGGTVSGGTAASATARTGALASTQTPSLATTSAQTAPFSGGPSPSAVAFPDGNQTPIEALMHIEQTTAPLSIQHQGQFPVVTLSFNLAPGTSLGEAVSAVNAARESLHMPASVQGQFQGAAAAFENSLGGEWMLILAAVVTVYIVLGVLYESFIHPL